MTDLKTLKDIMNAIPYEEVTRTRLADDLRAEAVKWYKYSVNQSKYYIAKEDLGQSVCHASTALWIKIFFNLTEEDIC